MLLTQRLVYPETKVDAVFAMLADPAYRQAVADYQHVDDFSCSIEPAGDGMRVRLEQAHGTDRIPGFARRLVGEEIRFVQDETWASPSSAVYGVTIPGKPGEVKGTARLEQNGADVVETLDLAVTAKIPLVGGKVEDLIGGFLGKAFVAENKVGVKWLAGEWRT